MKSPQNGRYFLDSPGPQHSNLSYSLPILDNGDPNSSLIKVQLDCKVL